MNRRLALIPITGLMVLSLAGCTTSPGGTGADKNRVINSTTNTSGTNVASNSTVVANNNAPNRGNTTTSVQISVGSTITSQANYGSEIALIESKGYAVSGTTPSATVQTSSGATLSAWMGVSGSDGHNQFVFFFLNGKYLGTDTAQPSLEITSAKAAGTGISVSYPVYKQGDSFANPTGTPVTITYTWNGSKLVPNKPYPKQFQASNPTTQGQNPTYQIHETSYTSSAAAANEISNIQKENTYLVFYANNPSVNLGYGVTAKQDGALDHAGLQWQEGNWTVETLWFGGNQGGEHLAKTVVAYLHTHMLPAPKSHGIIIVQSTNLNSKPIKPSTILAWQEGSKVYQLQQPGDPMTALQAVINSNK